MAIASIIKPGRGNPFKLRFPFRQPSRRNPGSPSPDTTPKCGGIPARSAFDKEEEELRQVFCYLDANNNGKISAEELKDYFASMGEPVSTAEAAEIIVEFSKGNGIGDEPFLGFEEFARMMEVLDNEEDDILRQTFEVFAAEKDGGCITPAGLQRVFRLLGHDKSRHECEIMIRAFDLDGNGVLDYQEFRRMMT